MALTDDLQILIRNNIGTYSPSWQYSIDATQGPAKALEGINSGSFAVWVKNGEAFTSGFETLWTAYGAEANYQFRWYSPDGGSDQLFVTWAVSDNSDPAFLTPAGSGGVIDQYNLFVVVRDGDSIKVYENGTLIDTETGIGTANNSNATATAFSMGSSKSIIKQFYCWCRALSDAEVAELYALGDSGYLGAGTPEAEFPFNTPIFEG